MSLLRSNFAHMAGGFALMGGWAALAHASYPFATQVKAGLTQGTLTAIITLGLKQVVEALSTRLPGLAGLILPPLVACAVSVSLLYTIHTLVGTPEVWTTLALPSTVATIYAALYTIRLRQTP
ncbi:MULTISPECIES: hypothetical protein [Roseovarius]|uniref:Uncharacterized protein n=2 Tax=Roseovarius TaxID=74030 RepID=A0ABZ2HHF3_9RHOB|nr:hypothetical protein [Roseovarius sp. W115]MDV2929372.1 hypothetical protein [Roseovarius sp. W115]